MAAPVLTRDPVRYVTEEEFLSKLREAGFEDPSIEPTRVYEFQDAKTFLGDAGLDAEVLAREIGGRVMGAFVRATKPAHAALPLVGASVKGAKSCCGPDCCS